MPISSDTVMKNFNTLLQKVNFNTRVTTKCFKILGVSTAFRCGLSTEEVRILGRWKSLESVQHYRHTLPWTLIEMSSNLTLKSISLTVDNLSVSSSTQTNHEDTQTKSALAVSFKYAQVYVEENKPNTSTVCLFSEPVKDSCLTFPIVSQTTTLSKSYKLQSAHTQSVGSYSTKSTCRQVEKQILDSSIIQTPYYKKKTISSNLTPSLSVSASVAASTTSATSVPSPLRQPSSNHDLVIIKEIRSNQSNLCLKDHDYI